MNDMAHEPQHGKSRGWRETIVGFLIVLIVLGLVCYAIAGSYESLAGMASRHRVPLARWAPLSLDGALVGALAYDTWLAWRKRPQAVMHQVARVFAAGSIVGNAWAGWPDAWGTFFRAFAPLMIVVFTEALRTDLLRDSQYRHDPIPLSRWFLAFPSTWRLWKRMKLWRIRSYTAAIDMELSRQRAIEQLAERFGEKWEGNVPRDLAWMLTEGVRMDEALGMVAKLLAAPRPQVTPSPARKRKPATAARKAPRNRQVQADPSLADLSSEAAALRLLDENPDISGSEIGRRIGTSEAYGRMLKAKLAGAEHETGPIPRVRD